MTGQGAEPAVGEPLEEQSTGVAMHCRGDLPGARDLEFANFHFTDHVARSGLRRRPSTDATRIRWRGNSRWWHAAPTQRWCALESSAIRRTATKDRWRSEDRGRRGR